VAPYNNKELEKYLWFKSTLAERNGVPINYLSDPTENPTSENIHFSYQEKEHVYQSSFTDTLYLNAGVYVFNASRSISKECKTSFESE
jgi:hypothetical protein